VDGYVVEGVDRERQLKRRKLLSEFDTLGRATDTGMNEFAATRDQAYHRILGEDLRVFDLTREPAKVREAYGRTWFGQACLVARRLVEVGVPYITVNYAGWDTHKNHFQTLNRNHPALDQGMSSLLQDLSARGLLDQTIVWWGGEFGRTPRVQWAPPWNGGRGHFGRCFTSLVAGGGFRGGQVVGASDRTGENVADRPIHPQDLLGSLCELMGIDPRAPMPNPKGLDVPIMAPPSEVGLLREIMKG